MDKNCLYKEIERWTVKYKKNSVKPSSYKRFMNSLQLIGRYSIAEKCLQDLTTDDLQNFLNEMVDDEYARETIKKPFKLICEFLEHSLYLGTIQKPIHKGVKMPSESAVLKKKRNIVAYDEREQAKLCRVLERGDSPCWLAALLMLDTGMRVGEVMALDWDDIDWRRRCVYINKTVIVGEKRRDHYVQSEPKTVSSVRHVALSTRVQRILKQLMEDGDEGFIFHDEFGNPMRYPCMKYWIRKACEEAEVKYRGLHVFRHTFATNCYYKGCDVKLLSKMLGHANVATTYNMYIHLYGDALEEMRSIIE